MVFMPFCYAEAAANLLTNPALDPFGKIPEFKFCAVRVSPAEGGKGRRRSRALADPALPCYAFSLLQRAMDDEIDYAHQG